jgi:cardiolipin synthase
MSSPVATAHPDPPIAQINGVALYTEGDALYAAMLHDIAQAHRRIRMESYIFATDEVGRPFVDALVERAQSGVAVELRIDAAGSLGMIDADVEAQLCAAGVRLERSHRWSWRRPFTVQRRNHRKLLVVDDSVAYIGGFNIHAESSRLAYGPTRWRDTHARIQGAAAHGAARAFDDYGARRVHRGLAVDDVYFLPNRGLKGRWILHRLLGMRFGLARRRIWVTTPYFVPDHATQRALARAARRGVDVRVLVPAKNDVTIVQWASRAAYTALLAAGVRLFEYRPRVLHAKTALIDDQWATIGTANMDYRSFFINDEINAVFERPDVVATLADEFERDLAESDEVRVARWQRRSWTAVVAEGIGWAARRWL